MFFHCHHAAGLYRSAWGPAAADWLTGGWLRVLQETEQLRDKLAKQVAGREREMGTLRKELEAGVQVGLSAPSAGGGSCHPWWLQGLHSQALGVDMLCRMLVQHPLLIHTTDQTPNPKALQTHTVNPILNKTLNQNPDLSKIRAETGTASAQSPTCTS